MEGGRERARERERVGGGGRGGEREAERVGETMESGCGVALFGPFLCCLVGCLVGR